MGDKVSIFAGGKLHRQYLDRIEGLESTTINGRFVLRISYSGDYLPCDWLMYRVSYLFVVDECRQILRAKCEGVHNFSGDPRRHAVFDGFHNIATGEVERIGQWSTLKVVFLAGEERREFMVKKKETPGVKKTS